METFKLKDASGAEQVYSAENGVKIPDENGEMQCYINKSRMDSYKAGLAAFGDAANEGAVICTPNFDKIQIFGKYEKEMQWLDSPYSTVVNQLGVSSEAVAEQLQTLIAENWNSIKNRISNLGSNTDGKALFMGKVCDAPKITDSTEKSLAGLLGVLAKSVSGMTVSLLDSDYLDTSACVQMYEGSSPYYFQAGTTASFPLLWQNAEDNGTLTEYKLNIETLVSDTSLAQMTAYTGKRAIYPITVTIGSESAGLSFGCFNAGAADGVTANLVAMFAGDAIFFSSAGAQSVPRSVILELARKAEITAGMDDDAITAALALPESMSIPAGLSVAITYRSSWVIAAEDSEDKNLQNAFQSVVFQLVSATAASLPEDMDEYTRTYFAGGTRKLYKAGKYFFAMEFNLVYPQTAEENTTSD